MRYPAIGGTRFRLYPSYAEGFAEPEVVELSLPAGTVRAGPSDHSMCVVNPVRKDAPYDPPHYVPPYRGPVYAPALPGPDGHFDHIPAETEQFLAAHLYGTVRWTLDIWEHYLRRRVVWLDADAHPQLELIPVVRWPNAQSGPGFLETGLKPNRMGRPQPFCLNYDVMAHETGHSILFSQIGVPEADQISVPFLAFHESFADLVALIGVLHFELGANPAAGADWWQSLRAEPGEPHRRDFRYRADTTGRQSCHHGRCDRHHARRRRHLDRSDRPGAKPTCRRRAADRRGVRYIGGTVSGRSGAAGIDPAQFRSARLDARRGRCVDGSRAGRGRALHTAVSPRASMPRWSRHVRSWDAAWPMSC